ncbi:MAG: hypothetical protein LBR72_03925, partial [Oscillospiraceae bacterium]|nr:hypothetical protein [Oscillospiraceae bacterium]
MEAALFDCAHPPASGIRTPGDVVGVCVIPAYLTILRLAFSPSYGIMLGQTRGNTVDAISVSELTEHIRRMFEDD